MNGKLKKTGIMHNRIMTLVTGGLILSTMMTSAMSVQKPSINIKLNEQMIVQNEATGLPYVTGNGRTMVPLRLVSEEMGYDVKWDKDTKVATIIDGGTTVRVAIGSTAPTVNGTVKTVDAPAAIKAGRTYVPVRFISEAMGAEVKFANKTVYIETEQGLSLPEVPSIGAKATYNYDVDSKVLMKYFGEHQTSYALHPSYENTGETVAFEVLRHYPGYDTEPFAAKIKVHIWTTDKTMDWMLKEGDSEEFVTKYAQEPKAVFKEVLKYYLPTGAEKLYAIIDDGYNDRLKNEDEVTQKDIQNIIGSDGKQVKIVFEEDGLAILIK